MRKLLFLFAATLMLVACAKSPKAIDRKQLQGKYEVDLSGLVANELDGEDDAVKAMAMYMLAQMHMTMEFQENNLVLDASDALRGIISAFSDDSNTMPIVVEYKIDNDSVLFTRNTDGEWRETGVLRKPTDTYEYLQWVPQHDADEPEMILSLRAVH